MDRMDKIGTHRWSILDLHSKKEIFFMESFGIVGLKYFIIHEDKKIIKKILPGIEKI